MFETANKFRGPIDMDTHSKHIVLAGTQLLRSNGVVCAVWRTGALSQRGQIIRRQMYHPSTPDLTMRKVYQALSAFTVVFITINAYGSSFL